MVKQYGRFIGAFISASSLFPEITPEIYARTIPIIALLCFYRAADCGP
jgi:hypothetical protein